MSRKVVMSFLTLIVVAGLGLTGVAAQSGGGGGDCPMTPQLSSDGFGVVTPGGGSVNLRDQPGLNGNKIGQLPEGVQFQVQNGPNCANGINWWYVSFSSDAGAVSGWIAEGQNGTYFVAPTTPVFTPTPVLTLPTNVSAPTMGAPTVSIPPVTALGTVSSSDLGQGYSNWDWASFIANEYDKAPDPLALTLPATYAGDLPALPVDLSQVQFLGDAHLNANQLALLAQNGFVVVPSGLKQMDDPYFQDAQNWDSSTGHAIFVTTDALLHDLHLAFDHMLMYLEEEQFFNLVYNMANSTLQTASDQYQQAIGTPLETPARNALVYYAVVQQLLEPGKPQGSAGKLALQTPTIPPDVASDAQTIVQMAMAGEGQLQVSILENYTEDFSQYKPRGHYDSDPTLQAYFRAMMWLGRITFRATSSADTLTGLLALRALTNSPDALTDWQKVFDTISFLIGPTDDLSPNDYGPISANVFGSDLASLGDASKLAAFLQQVNQLPGPRINSLVLPAGATANQVQQETRGFRLMGQRFTLDGFIMQQLIYPEVGAAGNERALPLGLDVASALGADIAYSLADAAGATQYANYTDHMTALRQQVSNLSAANWMENVYGGWLWTLQPLWNRNPQVYPPLMNTRAWLQKDLQSGLASWTELKHDTLLYAEQPYGGLGGGGERVVQAYGFVEPNPLVFSRIAVVAALTEQGLEARGLTGSIGDSGPSGLNVSEQALRSLALLAADCAEIARKELAGEPLTQDELLMLQYDFGERVWYVRYLVESVEANPPDRSAIVADVATNADAGTVLEEGTGEVDFIYVVTRRPDGLQITRGGVNTYYEFQNDINNRLTDEQWRTMVANGQTPARPDWVSAFYAP